MARLIAKSASQGMLPVKVGTLALRDVTPARMTVVAPWPGQTKAMDKALRHLGLRWPDPGKALSVDRIAILWSGRGQAFLVNAPPEPLAPWAAITDVSDGWTVMALLGAGAATVLARLVPIDLSDPVFPAGTTARTALGHMPVLLYRSGQNRFHLCVMRSMTATAVHEIRVAMASVAARARR